MEGISRRVESQETERSFLPGATFVCVPWPDASRRGRSVLEILSVVMVVSALVVVGALILRLAERLSDRNRR